MNQYGRIFKVTIYGESHGSSVGVIVDGIPAGIPIIIDDFKNDLSRRQGGNHHATTPRKEDDLPNITSGVFKDYSTGAPIHINFTNNNIRSSDYDKHRAIHRPGHADFVAHHRFKGYEDYRGSGHFSARLTVGIVAAGVIAKKILGQAISITASVISVHGNNNIEEALSIAQERKDSVGGIIECCVNGLPIGIGEPFWDSVESSIAHACFSIPAVKGIEFGSGFGATSMYGSEHNDSIINKEGKTITNNAGGIVGGLTNGNELIFRIAIKPASSTPATQSSYNNLTNAIEEFNIEGRHDLCVALRAPVVVEAMTAIALTDLMMIKKATEGSFS